MEVSECERGQIVAHHKDGMPQRQNCSEDKMFLEVWRKRPSNVSERQKMLKNYKEMVVKELHCLVVTDLSSGTQSKAQEKHKATRQVLHKQ